LLEEVLEDVLERRVIDSNLLHLLHAPLNALIWGV
jgi:hypothetical protein